ncbi:DUF742 domain-containing protein [Streptomyces sp. SID10815]|uniref:DUF742 domain-containing protein n=1 Tax=Streptomyces sp. SID10815 TaxID=2706027 RepID=UPI0013C55C1D|nr:DUF742 domain-containing protein [Streptomyces sp. SID10815]NEA46085.1 DUF742 domain-containing protein [Streptomyces sp. SID10815]
MTPPRRRRRSPAPPPEPPPPAGAEGGRQKNPERLYVVAGAGEDGARAAVDLVTLIVAHAEPPPSASPEQAALLRLCSAPLSAAELSAYLSLPFSAITVLITELLAAELVQARAPIVRRAVPDRSLLEAVMHGLQRL